MWQSLDKLRNNLSEFLENWLENLRIISAPGLTNKYIYIYFSFTCVCNWLSTRRIKVLLLLLLLLLLFLLRTFYNWINVARGRSFVWIFPTKERTLNECDNFLLCFVLLVSVLHSHGQYKKKPGCKKFFFFSYFLIVRCAVYLLKNAAEWYVLFGIAVLPGNI